jgi:ankyrin repeat protein
MTTNLRATFIKAATWHGSLDEAEQLLSSHPSLASSDIHTASITGNVDAVRRFLAEDRTNATAISEPYGGNALVYLCLSKFLRLDNSRSDAFLQAATALLEAGADANSGFWTKGDYPEFETALYGAAGVAHHEALTRLLLAHGADPNDGEAAYHSPETHNSEAMVAVVETGKLTAESLAIMLIRKLDWHDYNGVKYLLAHGANPNGERERGWYALHHALARDNAPSIIKLLIEHGADPFLINEEQNAIVRAARTGRSDILNLFAEHGIAVELDGVNKLIAACTMGDGTKARVLIQESPSLLQDLMTISDELLARFCLTANKPGVQQLLDLGVDVNTPYANGDGYFNIPAGSLPIHVASWFNHAPIVKLLIERGALIDIPDKNGLTPLALAVKACVDSYWTERRTPDSVKALLDAGASSQQIAFPTGYDEVDDLLQKSREGSGL